MWREGRYYSDAVAWAAENGIVTGITDTLFALNQPVTREQLVTMIGRYAEKKGIEIVAKGDLSAYPDASNVSNYAKAYMIWAVENGIVNGAGGKLMPKDGKPCPDCSDHHAVLRGIWQIIKESDAHAVIHPKRGVVSKFVLRQPRVAISGI